jgi:hypothetical protein
MSEGLIYETWFASQWNLLRPATRMQMPSTLDEIEALAGDVARNGSEYDSSAETLAIAVDGLLTELRARRAADLSAEDVEALRWITIHLENATPAHSSSLIAKYDAAFALLDRLVKGAGK